MLFSSLYAKLTAVFLVLVLSLAAVLIGLAQNMSKRYSLEVMQQLNRSVAMYIAAQEPLIINHRANEAAFEELASRAMILNPSLEIYILDTDGKVLSYRLDAPSLAIDTVALAPITSFLEGQEPLPIFGDDPLTGAHKNIISVAPLQTDNQLQGYVYVVIGGQMYQALKASIKNSYVMFWSLLWMLGGIVIAVFVGGALFFILTQRLRQLHRSVSQFKLGQPARLEELTNEAAPRSLHAINRLLGNDEIDQLRVAFTAMAEQIQLQFQSLQSLDTTRRELIANVSHDLRTPLSSMQGYIETLIIKNASLSEAQRSEYLHIAHKHSQNLAQLIAELFELAKLDAGETVPKLEPFSLLELAYDCVQTFQLHAQKRGVLLHVATVISDVYVVADIALIHRVLQNLVDNALRHTPKGGEVSIKLTNKGNNTIVEVSDTGVGITTHEIPYIFERFYQSQQHQAADKIGIGLGLAIVKRILDLHQCSIKVNSVINRGTSFKFELPLYTTNIHEAV